MKFAAAAVVAAAVGASAHANVSYTTEVVEVYTTYCPAATEITHGGKTYTVTEATTLTISDCPCTITKPVYTTSAVVCHDCSKAPPAHTNGSYVPVVPTTPSSGGGSYATPSAPGTTGGGSSGNTPTAGAGKVAALSGAAFAGVFALVAFL